MRLSWGPNLELGTVESNDGKTAFRINGTMFSNGQQCIGASFPLGQTYIQYDPLSGSLSMIVWPADAPSPANMEDNGQIFVRATEFLEALERMRGATL